MTNKYKKIYDNQIPLLYFSLDQQNLFLESRFNILFKCSKINTA